MRAGIQLLETGDYSDVKVVTPFGEIAWRDVSRLSDGDMKLPPTTSS